MRLSSMAVTAACCLSSASAFSLSSLSSKRPYQSFKLLKMTQVQEVALVEEARDVSEMKEITRPESPKQFDFSDPLKPVVFGEELVIPFSGTTVDHGNMKNDGLYSWMYPYMNLMGFKSGNTLVGGIATEATTDLPEAEMEALRLKAAKDMTNISDEERSRRRELGNFCYAISAVYAAFSAILLDDGSFSGHAIRFAVFLPLVLARGLEMSANRGL